GEEGRCARDGQAMADAGAAPDARHARDVQSDQQEQGNDDRGTVTEEHRVITVARSVCVQNGWHEECNQAGGKTMGGDFAIHRIRHPFSAMTALPPECDSERSRARYAVAVSFGPVHASAAWHGLLPSRWSVAQGWT